MVVKWALLMLASLAFVTPAMAQTAADRVRYGALPPSVQRLVQQQRTDCGSDTSLSEVAAYRLDANGDDHADFVFVPSSELVGTAGFCTANWIPVLLWTFDGTGGYNELVLGSNNALFVSGNVVLSSADCDDNFRWDGIGLAVINREGTAIVGLGGGTLILLNSMQ